MATRIVREKTVTSPATTTPVVHIGGNVPYGNVYETSARPAVNEINSETHPLVWEHFYTSATPDGKLIFDATDAAATSFSLLSAGLYLVTGAVNLFGATNQNIAIFNPIGSAPEVLLELNGQVIATDPPFWDTANVFTFTEAVYRVVASFSVLMTLASGPLTFTVEIGSVGDVGGLGSSGFWVPPNAALALSRVG